MLIWAFLSKLPDIMEVIGFGTVLYWTVKLTLWGTRHFRRAGKARS